MKNLKCDHCEGMFQVEEKDISKNRYAIDDGDKIREYVLCKKCFEELQEVRKKATKDFLETKSERGIICSCCGNKIALENAAYCVEEYFSVFTMKREKARYIICPVCRHQMLMEDVDVGEEV